MTLIRIIAVACFLGIVIYFLEKVKPRLKGKRRNWRLKNKMAKRKKVSFNITATKIVKKPVIVKFRRSDGSIARIRATKFVRKPVKVTFVLPNPNSNIQLNTTGGKPK